LGFGVFSVRDGSQKPGAKNTNFLKPKKRPKEALFGLKKMVLFVRTCSGMPDL